MNKKGAHFKKIEKREFNRSKKDNSVACKAYKQSKKEHREQYEEWV